MGSHHMVLKRPSRQPDSGREYMAGDPVQLIDWKAYARTDQLIIREVRDEATARVFIGFDISESMQWPPSPSDLPTKASVAYRLAFHLAHLHLRMGDLVELWVVDQQSFALPNKMIRPRSLADVSQLFALAESRQFSQDALEGHLEERPLGSNRRDIVFWISDALGQVEWFNILALGKRSLFFHLLSSRERHLGWVDNQTAYFDESFAVKEYQGQVLKQRYAAELEAWTSGLMRRQQELGGTFIPISDATEIESYLSEVLAFVKLALVGRP